MKYLQHKFCFLLFIILGSFCASGQHCQYDGAALYAVNVHLKNDTTPLVELKIFMMDSLGKPWTHQAYNPKLKKWQTDTSYFHINPPKSTFKGVVDNNHPMIPSKMRFPEAKDYYVLLAADYVRAEQYYVVLMYKGKKYRRQLKPENQHSMCSSLRYDYDKGFRVPKKVIPIEFSLDL